MADQLVQAQCRKLFQPHRQGGIMEALAEIKGNVAMARSGMKNADWRLPNGGRRKRSTPKKLKP
jgi:hypothetical protein